MLAWIALAFAGFFVVVLIVTLAQASPAVMALVIFAIGCVVVGVLAGLKDGVSGFFREQKKK